ncbi:hypothetical protein Tco_0826315 [Tanacetum coccineum]
MEAGGAEADGFFWILGGIVGFREDSYYEGIVYPGAAWYSGFGEEVGGCGVSMVYLLSARMAAVLERVDQRLLGLSVVVEWVWGLFGKVSDVVGAGGWLSVYAVSHGLDLVGLWLGWDWGWGILGAGVYEEM